MCLHLKWRRNCHNARNGRYHWETAALWTITPFFYSTAIPWSQINPVPKNEQHMKSKYLHMICKNLIFQRKDAEGRDTLCFGVWTVWDDSWSFYKESRWSAPLLCRRMLSGQVCTPFKRRSVLQTRRVLCWKDSSHLNQVTQSYFLDLMANTNAKRLLRCQATV